MIQLSNTAALTLAAGETATFDTVLYNSCNNKNEYYILGTGSINVVPGVYDVSFGGNLGAAVANTPVQVAIAFNGAPLLGTTMETTPAGAIGDPNAVYRSRRVRVPCGIGGASFSIINNGTAAVTIDPGAIFSVERRG